MAATTSTSSSPPPPPSPPPNRQYNYDVFLSFRGEETRNKLASHLFAAFERKGISSFRDDDMHLRGRELSPALVKAICASRVAVVLLSPDYASSTWCLDELAKILECKQKLGQKVFPIFYDVNPSEPRKLTGKFGDAMGEHDQRFADNKEKVQRWRAALQEVSNVSGWESNGRSEATLVQDIGDLITEEVMKYRSDAKDLFGMPSRIQELRSLLRVGSNDDVRFVGIWGMGGIGKSTLAEAVYDQISWKFDSCCFLANVKEQGLVHLQEKLLSKILMGEKVYFDTTDINKRFRARKTLIVLDDVDHKDQLDKLAGKHDWFGPGTRVIITTRDEQLLIAHGVDEIYKATELEMHDALQLFCRKAFREEGPPSDYVELVNALIDYAKGLPLALSVLGSSLCGKSTKEWGSALHKFRTSPHDNIQKVLRLSYDGLDDAQKNLFLDLACFLDGINKYHEIELLDDNEFDFSVLVEKSLLTTNDKEVWMHDLLREMGREIVRQESPEKPGKRSRLWLRDDVIRVLTENSGTEEVRGIVLNLHGLAKVTVFSSEAFARMSNLRLLRIYSKRLESSRSFLRTANGIEVPKILHLTGRLEFLSDELTCLYWLGFPLKSLPTSFHPQNLVQLSMPYSRIKKLQWKGNTCLPELKVLDLSWSQNLTKTPDFSGVPKLEKLSLEGCANLSEVHPSLGILKRLRFLTLDDCKNLRRLPRAIEWESLRRINLKGCSKLEKFPDILVNITQLDRLFWNATSIKELPPSINNLSGLTHLDLFDCKNLESLPPNICMLESLRTLRLWGCSKLDKLPEDLGNLKSLSTFVASETAITQLPQSFAQLTKLDVLYLRGCKQRGPKSVRGVLSSFHLSPSKDQLSMSLDLSLISKISSLEELCLSGCKLSAFPYDFGRLRSLRNLNLSECSLSAIPDDIGRLASLKLLNLSRNHFISLPPTLAQLPLLYSLKLKGCERLEELPMLPPYMRRLHADGCTSLQRLQAVNFNTDARFEKELHWWESFLEFRFTNCFKLVENQGMDDLLEKLLLNQVQVCLFLSHALKHRQTRATLNLLERSELKEDIEVFIPGREIPKWLGEPRSMGESVCIPLPPDGHDSVNGMVVCAVLKSNHGRRPYLQHPPWKYGKTTGGPAWIYSIGSVDKPKFKSTKDHLWLAYTPLPRRRDEFSEIEVRLNSNPDSGLVIEKWAAHFISCPIGSKAEERACVERKSATEDSGRKENTWKKYKWVLLVFLCAFLSLFVHFF